MRVVGFAAWTHRARADRTRRRRHRRRLRARRAAPCLRRRRRARAPVGIPLGAARAGIERALRTLVPARLAPSRLSTHSLSRETARRSRLSRRGRRTAPQCARADPKEESEAGAMDLDAVLLARIQFAFTITFHIIFPSFTIGLAAFIATLLVRWRMTGREHLHRLARFWTKIFAVSFAMGVVSGIVLSYQFGTNWSNFSVVVGNVLGPLLGYEVLTAFFLEATFLGIMLFGWQRVPPNLHVLSAVLVAVGTSLSAFWILAANSWMQTPAGHEVLNGIAYPVDWIADHLQPELPLPLRAHVHRRLPHHLARRAGGRRPLPRQGPLPRGSQDHDAHGPRHGRHPGAAAGLHRRPARPQHRQVSAGQVGGHREPLGRLQTRRRSCCSPFPTRPRSATTTRSPSRVSPA